MLAKAIGEKQYVKLTRHVSSVLNYFFVIAHVYPEGWT